MFSGFPFPAFFVGVANIGSNLLVLCAYLTICLRLRRTKEVSRSFNFENMILSYGSGWWSGHVPTTKVFLHVNQGNYQWPVMFKKGGLWFLREVACEKKGCHKKLQILIFLACGRPNFVENLSSIAKLLLFITFFTYISKNTFHALQNCMKKWPAPNVACAKTSAPVGGLSIMRKHLTHNLSAVLGSCVQCCPCEASEQKMGQKLNEMR